jgi:hypothetical protein
MADPKPITPFFSTDPRVIPQPSDQQEQQEPKLCGHCGESEPWVGLCDRMGDLCGKPLIVEVP